MRKIATMNIIRRCIIEIIFVSICFIFSEVQAVDAELTPNQDESNINKIKEFNIDLDDIDKTDINVCIEDPDITFEFGEFTEYIGYTLEKLRTIEKKDAFCAIRACDDALKIGGFKYSTGEENLLYAVKRDLDGKLPYFFNSFQRGYWFHLNKTQKGGLNLEKRTTLSWCLIQVLRDDLSKSVFKHEFSSKKKSSNIISTLGFFAQELDPTPQRIPNFAQEYEMMLKRDPNFAQEYVSSEENPGPSLPPKKRFRIVSDVLAEAGPSQSGDRMNINVIEPAVAGIIGGTSQAADVGSSQIGNPILEPGPSQIGSPILEPGQPKNKRVRKPKAGPIQREEPMEINTLESAHQVFSGSPQADDGQLPKKRRRQPKAGTLHFEGPTDINVLGSVPPEVLSVTAYAVDDQPQKKRGSRPKSGQAKKKGARNSKAGPIQRAEPLQINILESSMIRNPMLEPTLPGTLGVPAQATDDVPGIIDEAAEAAKALKEKKKKYETDRKRRYREKNAREQAEKEKEAQRNGESRANPFDTLQELSARHIAMQPMRNQQPLTNLMLGGFDEKSDDVSQQDIASISDLNPRLLNLLEDQANARRTEQAKINQPINTDLTLGVKPDAQIIDFFEERVNQPINTNLTLGKIDDPVQREEPMELINVFASDMKRKEEANRKRKNMENYRQQNDTPHFSILRNTNPELLQENRSQIRANQAKINQLPDIELVDLSEEPDANVRINNAEIAEQSQNYQQPDTDLTLGVITDKSADVRTNNYGFEQAKSNQVFDTDLTLRAIGGNSDANMRTNNYGRTEQAKRNAIIDTGLILGAIGGNSDDIPQQGRVSTSGLNRIYSTHPNTVDDISQQGTASNLGMNRIYSTLPNTVDNISQLDRVNTSGLNRIYSTLPNTVEGIYQQGGASTSGMNRIYSTLPNTVDDTSQLGRVSTSGLNRIYSTLPNTVDDISQQGGPSTSRFNNIFQHGGASTSRFNNISQQGRVSTLGLNRNYFNLPKTYDISQQGGASTSRLNRISLPNTTDDISHQAIANTLGLNRIYSAFPNTVDDISQQGRASTSGLNNITQQGRASTSGLNNISQQVRASTSGLNNTSQQGGASISRLNRISLPNTIGDILQQNIASTTGLNTNIPNLPNPADGKVLVWATIKVCVDEIEFARTNAVSYKLITLKFDFATLYSAYLFVQKSNSDSPYAKSPKDWCNHVYL